MSTEPADLTPGTYARLDMGAWVRVNDVRKTGGQWRIAFTSAEGRFGTAFVTGPVDTSTECPPLFRPDLLRQRADTLTQQASALTAHATLLRNLADGSSRAKPPGGLGERS